MTASMTEFASAEKGFSLISNRKLLALYAAMVECRSLAEESRGRAKGKRVAGVGPLLGNEAGVVGTLLDLLAHDTVATALRPGVLKQINSLPGEAASVADAARAVRGNAPGGGVALAYSNGKQAARNSWQRAMADAVERRLPILFVSLGPDESASSSLGLPVIAVDGNDVVAVYRVASESITHARKGHGPTAIVCVTHGAGDPIQTMQAYLIRKGLDPAEFAR
jgi:TPP-dependent pyruvate/acetoin dehydrogenase alpha subunit